MQTAAVLPPQVVVRTSQPPEAVVERRSVGPGPGAGFQRVPKADENVHLVQSARRSAQLVDEAWNMKISLVLLEVLTGDQKLLIFVVDGGEMPS